jgi:hypothetical protein
MKSNGQNCPPSTAVLHDAVLHDCPRRLDIWIWGCFRSRRAGRILTGRNSGGSQWDAFFINFVRSSG